MLILPDLSPVLRIISRFVITFSAGCPGKRDREALITKLNLSMLLSELESQSALVLLTPRLVISSFSARSKHQNTQYLGYFKILPIRKIKEEHLRFLLRS